MTECQQRRSIVLRESIEQRMTGSLKVRQPFSRHARAGVEREKDVQRDLLKADEIDRLRYAVVAHLEVAGAEPGDDLAAVGHEHVHSNRLALRRKGRLLRRRSHRAPISTATLAATSLLVIQAISQSAVARLPAAIDRPRLNDLVHPPGICAFRFDLAAVSAPARSARERLPCRLPVPRDGSVLTAGTAPSAQAPPLVHTTAGPPLHYRAPRARRRGRDARRTAAPAQSPFVLAAADRPLPCAVHATRARGRDEFWPRGSSDFARWRACTAARRGAARHPRPARQSSRPAEL